MALELKDLILGESSDTLHTSSSEEVAEGTLALTLQARRSLNIFTQHLDHRIYNSEELYDAVLKLATRSRYSLVRILIQDSMPVAKSGNRLVELSYRISSRVQIRKPPVEHEDFKEEFVIADGCGLMRRTNPNRYEGELCFNAAMKVRQLDKFFDDCWEHSAADPQLRRLHL
jgi:hypothetical protein